MQESCCELLAVLLYILWRNHELRRTAGFPHGNHVRQLLQATKNAKKIRHLTSCMLRETWLFQRTKCQIWGNKCLQYTAWGRLGKVLKLYIFKDFAYIQGFEIWRVHACYFKNYKIFDISMNHHWRMKDFVHISMPIYAKSLNIYIYTYKAFPSWPFIFDWNISMYIKAHLLAFPYITIQKTWVLYKPNATKQY